MPHVVVEYSANLDDRLDIPALLRHLHACALSTGVFPPGGTRTRAARREYYCVADEHPDNAFINVMMRIGHGRDMETRRRAAQSVFDALRAFTSEAFDKSPLSLSLDLQEIDPELSFKHNNIHDYVAQRKERQTA